MNRIRKLDIDKMDVDKVLRFGNNSWYQTYSQDDYDRSSIKEVTPITKKDILKMIDSRYINGIQNKYMKVYKTLDDYILWRESPKAYEELQSNRNIYLKKKLMLANKIE